MIIIGVVLLIVGLVTALHILFIVGIVIAAIGLVVELGGGVTQRRIGGRHWY